MTSCREGSASPTRFGISGAFRGPARIPAGLRESVGPSAGCVASASASSNASGLIGEAGLAGRGLRGLSPHRWRLLHVVNTPGSHEGPEVRWAAHHLKAAG